MSLSPPPLPIPPLPPRPETAAAGDPPAAAAANDDDKPARSGRWGRRQRGLGGPWPVILRKQVHRGFDAALVVGIVVAIGGRQGRGREGSRKPCQG